MKSFFGFNVIFLLALCVCVFSLPKLEIYEGSGETGRYLAQNINGEQKPFFYAADTAWNIFHELSDSEVDEYLSDRKSKGFNVIQAVAFFFYDTISPNYEGEYALLGSNHSDVSQPNPKFFQRVDKIIAKIESAGFYLALWPIWGSSFISDGGGGHKYPILDADSTYTLAKYIANFLKDRENIIWVNGGDIKLPVSPPESILAYRNMAEGIAEGYLGLNYRPKWNDTSEPAWKKILMSLHPYSGVSSSLQFENDAWMTFNLIQSGWGNWQKIFPLIEGDWNTKTPIKPTFMGEGAYEWAPYTYCSMPNKTNDQWGVRLNAYWSTFAGGFGFTYGANGIWDFCRKPTERVPYVWTTALQFPGGSQVQYVKDLYESQEFQKLRPDQDHSFVAIAGEMANCSSVVATIADDGSFGFVYSTQGLPFKVDLGKLKTSSNMVEAVWMDPRNGDKTVAGKYGTNGTVSFSPKGGFLLENDWVLILKEA